MTQLKNSRIGQNGLRYTLWALVCACVFGSISDGHAQAGSLSELIWQLGDPSPDVRREAADALGASGDPRSVKPLIGVLKDDSFRVRIGAAYALGKIGSPAVEPLIVALEDGNPLVREGAAIALGHIQDSRALKPLNAALMDPTPEVRESAQLALDKIRNNTAADEASTKVVREPAPQDEPFAWQSASNAGSPKAFSKFFHEYPNSAHLKIVTGTLRGRYWLQMLNTNITSPDQISAVGNGRRGVVVTVEGMDAAMNLSLEDAIGLGVIGSRPAIRGENAEADGTIFSSGYFEVESGTTVVGEKVITPKDFLNCTIVLSADGSRLLAWDLGKATPALNPSPGFTMKKGPDGSYPCGLACSSP